MPLIHNLSHLYANLINDFLFLQDFISMNSEIIPDPTQHLAPCLVSSTLNISCLTPPLQGKILEVRAEIIHCLVPNRFMNIYTLEAQEFFKK